MQNERTLIIGTERKENEHLRSWLQAHGRRAWFSETGLGGMRVFEEIEPTEVILDTGLRDYDVERLARIIRRAAPATRLTFLVQHILEAPHFEDIKGLGATRTEMRPLDPYRLFRIDEPESGSRLGGLPTHGSARPSSVAEVIATVVRTGETGTLYLQSGRLRKILYFIHGQITWAESNILAENFGQFLLQRGTINAIELDWARSLQMNEGIRQGEALVKIGVLKDEEMEELLGLQIREKCVNALRMPTADYLYSSDQHFVTSRPSIGLNAIDILSEGLSAGEASLAVSENVRESGYLRLASGANERLLRSLGGALNDKARDAFRSGKNLHAIAAAQERSIAWARAFATSAILVGAANWSEALDDVERAAVLSLPDPDEAFTSGTAMTVDDRIKEIRQMRERSQHDPWRFAGLPQTASRAEVCERLGELLQRFGSFSFSQGLPPAISAQLADLLTSLRSADLRLRSGNESREHDTVDTEHSAEDMHEKGVAAFLADDHQGAILAFESAASLSARDPRHRALLSLCRFLVATDGDPLRDQSAQLIERILEQDPVCSDSRFARARILEERGSVDDARALYTAILRIEPEHRLASASLKRVGP